MPPFVVSHELVVFDKGSSAIEVLHMHVCPPTSFPKLPASTPHTDAELMRGGTLHKHCNINLQAVRRHTHKQDSRIKMLCTTCNGLSAAPTPLPHHRKTATRCLTGCLLSNLRRQLQLVHGGAPAMGRDSVRGPRHRHRLLVAGGLLLAHCAGGRCERSLLYETVTTTSVDSTLLRHAWAWQAVKLLPAQPPSGVRQRQGVWLPVGEKSGGRGCVATQCE